MLWPLGESVGGFRVPPVGALGREARTYDFLDPVMRFEL